MSKEIYNGPDKYETELERLIRVAYSGQQIKTDAVNPDSRAAVLRSVNKKRKAVAQNTQGSQQ